MRGGVALYDRERCRDRRALAACRGIEATPVKFYGSAPPADLETATVVSAGGDMPAGDDAVNRINAILGLSGADRLRRDQLHVRYLEAGNTNYIKSRLMFLAPSTLSNIARAAEDGFAFMNSHRTGGLSSDPEIPLGRTFAGRHETLALAGGREFHRTLLGVYMLRGQFPNGKSGPSTDAIAEGIDAGTIFDVSLGLKGPARLVCDVCDNEFSATNDDGEYLCTHVPGTSRGMSDEQRDHQRQRGVDNGVATYSIHDATAGEISAVFDGAVPGAGFRRMLSAYADGGLSAAQLAEARLSYGPLLGARFGRPASRRAAGAGHEPRRSLFIMKRGATTKGRGGRIDLPTLFDGLRDGDIDPGDVTVDLSGGDDEGADTPPARPAQGARSDAAPSLSAEEVAKLREDLRIEREAREKAEKERLAERRQAALAAIDRDVDAAVEANRESLTGETAKTFRAALKQAGLDDLDHPLDGGARRFDALKALQAGAAKHGHDKERIAHKKPEVLPNYGASADGSGYDPHAEARKQNEQYMPATARKNGAPAGASKN